MQKTKVMMYNIKDPLHHKTSSVAELKKVDDLKYLGLWVETTEKDIKISTCMEGTKFGGLGCSET
jgi:hypothetical protein